MTQSPRVSHLPITTTFTGTSRPAKRGGQWGEGKGGRIKKEEIKKRKEEEEEDGNKEVR